MEEGKKNIIITILFLLMVGLIIAILIVNNKEKNLQEENKNKIEEKEKEIDEEEKENDKVDEVEEEKKPVAIKVTYGSLKTAISLVNKVKASLNMDDYTKALLSVSKLKNGNSKKSLQKELTDVLHFININEELDDLLDKSNNINNKDEITKARNDRDSLLPLINEIEDEDLKKLFMDKIALINELIGTHKDIIVTGVENNKYYNKDVIINIEDALLYNITLNDLPFISDSSVSEEGTYVLVVKDAMYNELSITFTIDKTAPVINYYSKIVGDKLIVMTNISNEKFVATDDNLLETYYSLYGTEEKVLEDKVVFTNKNKYTYKAVDKAGNESSVNILFDNEHPNLITTGDYSEDNSSFVGIATLKIINGIKDSLKFFSTKLVNGEYTLSLNFDGITEEFDIVFNFQNIYNVEIYYYDGTIIETFINYSDYAIMVNGEIMTSDNPIYLNKAEYQIKEGTEVELFKYNKVTSLYESLVFKKDINNNDEIYNSSFTEDGLYKIVVKYTNLYTREYEIDIDNVAPTFEFDGTNYKVSDESLRNTMFYDEYDKPIVGTFEYEFNTSFIEQIEKDYSKEIKKAIIFDRAGNQTILFDN